MTRHADVEKLASRGDRKTKPRDDDSTSRSLNGIQVIARAAAILRALKHERAGLSLAQIAERVNLPRSTVQRIVTALVAERLILPASPDGGFRLGPEIQSLASSGTMDISDLLRPVLVALSEKTGETVDLAVLRGNRMVFVEQIPGRQRLRAVSAVGESFPLTTTANGKACLSVLEPATALRLMQKELGNSRSGASSSRAEALGKEISAIRRSGLAFDLGEHTDGISAAGIAFEDTNGNFYAISVPAPSHRFASEKQRIAEALLAIRRDVVRLVGR